MALVTFTARSLVGIPFVWTDPMSPSYRVVIGTETSTISESPETLAQMLLIPGLQIEYPPTQEVATQLAVVRARRSAAQARLQGPHPDPSYYPATVIVRARRLPGETTDLGVQALDLTWRAYEMAPQAFSTLRFRPLAEVELLDPTSAPPLTHVRVCGVGKFLFGRCFGMSFEELALYPWEIPMAQAKLSFEVFPQPSQIGTDLRPLAVVEVVAPAGPVPPTELVARHAPQPIPTSSSMIMGVASLVEAVDDSELVPREEAQPARPAAKTTKASDDDHLARLALWARNPTSRGNAAAVDGLTMADVLEQGLQLPPEAHTRSLEIRAARVLADCGWEHLPLRLRNGARVRPYRPRLTIG